MPFVTRLVGIASLTLCACAHAPIAVQKAPPAEVPTNVPLTMKDERLAALQACHGRAPLAVDGSLQTELLIDAKGAVIESKVDAAHSTLVDEALIDCVRVEVKNWKLMPSGSNDNKIVTTIYFRSTPNRQVHIGGSIHKEAIRSVVRAHMNEIRSCYEKELNTNPSLTGRVMCQFRISPTGAVDFSRIETSSFANESLEKCICDSPTGWSFPKPDGGGFVVVSYPFVLKPPE